MYAYNDIPDHAVCTGTDGRRFQEIDDVREWIVSSYDLSDTVCQLIPAARTTRFHMDHIDDHHICIRDHNARDEC